ncbi:MAG: hypothetical protein KDB71_12710 [Mycobacterium sp.]|nr:hypothetical protein [Mycobacterium sp.]
MATHAAEPHIPTPPPTGNRVRRTIHNPAERKSVTRLPGKLDNQVPTRSIRRSIRVATTVALGNGTGPRRTQQFRHPFEADAPGARTAAPLTAASAVAWPPASAVSIPAAGTLADATGPGSTIETAREGDREATADADLLTEELMAETSAAACEPRRGLALERENDAGLCVEAARGPRWVGPPTAADAPASAADLAGESPVSANETAGAAPAHAPKPTANTAAMSRTPLLFIRATLRPESRMVTVVRVTQQTSLSDGPASRAAH